MSTYDSSSPVSLVNRGLDRGQTVKLFGSINGHCERFSLLLVNKAGAADHPGTGQILSPEWINLGLLKHWIAQCCRLHPTCTTAMNTASITPALLVDVKRRCIVSGIRGCHYVALSYRFGEAPHFKLGGTLLNQLRDDFALDSCDILESLPLIVQHAMALVNTLGERYLWTDSLCITHEDPDALAGQLEQMAAIYSSALFTIVATDGDGTRGLLGLPGISEPRKLSQQVVEFGTEKLVLHRFGGSVLSKKTDYHKRGWTYQEFLMSTRKLIFMESEAHWMCQCCHWHEVLVRDMEVDKHVSPHSQLLVAGFPDLKSLSSFLCQYNTRSLTYDEDALPAIAGWLSVLSRTFTGGFLYGLPEMMFDTALG